MSAEKQVAEPRVVTGIRPTGDLSIANYVGAMKPIGELQDSYPGPINAFVADIHGLTDQEPGLISSLREDTVRSFIAAGIDPERVNIYLQTQIEEPTVILSHYLDRHVSVAELLRVPTLKDKLKKGQGVENVNVALARYPILMASDIFVQDATDVPVGQDQHAHIEFARDLARKFNNEYGEGEAVIIVPQIMAVRALRILALNGEGKMSKSNPRGAIFLKDSPDVVGDKVKRAQTAAAGEMNDVLESHFTLCEELCTTPEQSSYLNQLRVQHLQGDTVMKEFKVLMTDLVNNFLAEFQEKYNSISDAQVQEVLEAGGEDAMAQASGVLARVKTAMGFED
jgi:tryptophanyl-tRNA synthetase